MGPVDVAFALLHGPFGEDGTIQGLFEMMGTRYVGAGVLASAVGMDKHFMKLVLAASGLPVGPFVPITPAEWARDPAACLEAVAALSYPLFVKPARGGSSLGISRVDDAERAGARRSSSPSSHDPKVIVEQGFVGARELECGVLADLDGAAPRGQRGGRDPGAPRRRASTTSRPSTCPRSRSTWTCRPTSTPRPPTQVAPAGGADLRGHRLRGPGPGGRVLSPATASADVNEINTMPGFTPHSMFPRMWAASGMPYPELVERLIRLALQRPLGLR